MVEHSELVEMFGPRDTNDRPIAVAVLGTAIWQEATARLLAEAGFELVTPGPGRRPDVAVVVAACIDSVEEARLHGYPVLAVVDERPNEALVVDLALAGADGIVSVDGSADELAHAVITVAEGGAAFPAQSVRLVLDALRTQPGGKLRRGVHLTPRELAILQSIANGDSVKQTARSLGVALKTVENTQSRLYRRLGVRNRAQAIIVAHERGLLTGRTVETPKAPAC